MSNSKEALFDPAKDSKGIWFLIHRQAVLAVTDAKKAEFINYMTFLSKEFPCEKCRKHIVQFIAENPFYLFMNVSYGSHPDVGMFKWSWALHNAVNTRLGKKNLDFATAYNLYKGENITVCTSGCSDEEKTPEPTKLETPKSAPLLLPTSKTTFRVTSANSRR